MSGEDNEQSAGNRVRGMEPSSFGTRLLWAPWDGRMKGEDFIGPALVSTTTLVSLILGKSFFFSLKHPLFFFFNIFFIEFFWSFVLGFAVVAARSYTTLGAGSNGLQDGFFIGATAASIWLLAWIWATDYNLKRHLNWAITVGYLLKFRVNDKDGDNGWVPDYGLLAFILYGGVQLAGAALAGALLLAFNLGNIPNPTAALLSAPTVAGSALTDAQAPVALAGVALDGANVALLWFVEFFGAMIIVLANIYNDERHQDKNNNAGDARENESDNHMRTGIITALAILTVTTFSYPLGSYSFGPVPYFAGLVSVGVQTAAGGIGAVASNPPTTRLIDYAHYLFTPMAGGAAGALVAFLVSALLTVRPNRSYTAGGARIMYQARYRSVQTPLTQQLLAKQGQSGLRVRQSSAQGPLKVNAFHH